ncbi:uncharacterized protein TNCV_4120311 [Trichonephila clavipes]|nr:uncharacterized protein TNCV_4120311 [Trichonephila clavipes]
MFKPKFEGPYRVLDVKNNNVVVWKAGKRLTINVDQVRIYCQRKCDETEKGTVSSDNGSLRDESSGFDRVQWRSNESRDSKKKGSERGKHNKEDQFDPEKAEEGTIAPTLKSEQDQATRMPDEEVINNGKTRKGEERGQRNPCHWRSCFAFNVIGSIAYHHISCYLATLDLNTLSNLNTPYFVLELIGNKREFIFPRKTPKKISGKFPFRFVTSHIKIMFDPSSFAIPTPPAHSDTSRDVFPRGVISQICRTDSWLTCTSSAIMHTVNRRSFGINFCTFSIFSSLTEVAGLPPRDLSETLSGPSRK